VVRLLLGGLSDGGGAVSEEQAANGRLQLLVDQIQAALDGVLAHDLAVASGELHATAT